VRKLQVNIAIDPAALSQLTDLAARRGVTLAHVVRAAVAAYLLDPDADLRRQLQVPPAPQPVVMTPPPAPATWRPPADPLAPRA
jgi:hypothetical protein